MKMTTSHLTKKRLTVLAAICSSGFLLAACEPSANQSASEQSETETTTTEQDGAPTYGQRDRDVTVPEDPAMDAPDLSPDTQSDSTTTVPPTGSPDTSSPDSSSSATDSQTDAETAF